MTFSAVLAAVAFVTAGETEGSFRAGLLAADALVTRSARALTVFGVTQPVTYPNQIVIHLLVHSTRARR